MLKMVIGVYDILWERDMRRRRIEGWLAYFMVAHHSLHRHWHAR
jgi:hypothetical protein